MNRSAQGDEILKLPKLPRRDPQMQEWRLLEEEAVSEEKRRGVTHLSSQRRTPTCPG